MAQPQCAACGNHLDARLQAVCEVCGGARYCVACAREHLCTEECAQRGCLRGLCMKAVREGVVAAEYGVDV